MSMTKEEAIEILKNGGWWESLIPVTTMKGRDEEDKLHEAIDLAISALRPITREQVERIRGKWEWKGPCGNNHGKFWETCSACGLRQRVGDYESFCPACGAPMTDEAVDMVMERVEAMKGEA